jgi:hypothetical protein
MLTATPAAAQHWDSPTFFSSAPPEDIGVYLTFPEGGDVGFMGIWRQGGSIGLGVRAGFTEFGDEGDILLGAEFYGGLGNLLSGIPLEAAWYSGVGATFGDGVDLYRVPLGVSLGLPLGTEGVRFRPYVLPRAVLDLVVFDDVEGDDTETEVDFALDLGADVAIGERLILKLGSTLTDNQVFGVGITWRMTRGVAIR